MSEAPLERAETLPAAWYFDDGIFALERERVFARSWQLLGRESRIGHPGGFFTAEIAGEPLVVVRDAAGTLRVLSAVCRHRAGPVASGSGRCRSLRCGYHGWTYGLDGSLLAAPDFEGVEGFDPAQIALPRFRVESWAGFLFVSLDPEAAPLAETLGVIPEETRPLPLARMSPYRSADYEVACNWKTYVDNYLEGYHIPVVHPALHRELDYSRYRVEPRQLHSRQHAPLRAEAAPDSVYAGGDGEALYYWLFPSTMLNLYPDNLQTNVVIPLGAERTLVRFEWSLLDPDRPAVRESFERGFALAERVQREDAAICESVQRGLRAPSYQRGRYSVRHENGVHHFHRLLRQRLGGDSESGPHRSEPAQRGRPAPREPSS